MMQIRSAQTLESIEPALRNAAQRQGANVISVIHLGQLLRAKQPTGARDAVIFTVCQADLSAALLAEDMRFAAFVPCRVAAFEQDGAITLEAASPAEICRLLQRPDLEKLAGALETALRAIMEEAAQPGAPATHAPAATQRLSAGAATEDQVYSRGSIPQRIDCHGTKVEELAGTGEHDSRGG